MNANCTIWMTNFLEHVLLEQLVLEQLLQEHNLWPKSYRSMYVTDDRSQEGTQTDVCVCVCVWGVVTA